MKTNTRRFMKMVLAAAITSGVGFAVTPATAQVRAAYVKNVDEPGRTPYQYVVDFSPASAGCSTSNCVIHFPAVPTGKRLVTESISAIVGFLGVPSTFIAFGVDDAMIINGNNIALVPATWVNTGHVFTTTTFYTMERPIRVYLEAGAIPRIKLRSNVDISWLNAQMTLHGYLIDAAN